MHPTFYLSPLVACMALTMASSAKSAEPITLDKETFKTIQRQFQLGLPGLKSAVGASSKDRLQFLRQHVDNRQINHIRLQQRYAGFPVLGGYAILHIPNAAQGFLNSSQPVTMDGMLFKGLDKELGNPAQDFVGNARIALDAFKKNYPGKAIRSEDVTPVVFMDEKNQAHWAYKVVLYIQNKDTAPEKPTAILDAKSYKPFVQWNDIKSKRVPVKGMGFGGNLKAGEFSYGKNYPLLEITRDTKLAKCYMDNASVKVVDMNHDYYSSNRPMTFNCKSPINDSDPTIFWTGYKGDGYDKINGAYSPSNDALYAGYVIKHLYHDWYGVEALTKRDGSPMKLVMRVHYGDQYENAYWDGEQMTFGDGESMMYPLVSLGVGAHEVSHGFTEQHSDLMYYGQSGGINESFSDMAAQAAEYYSVGTNSWQIGPEIMKEGSGWDALRYMDKPSRDGRSIDRADQYYDGLDVHYTSGVYNHLFYILAQKPGWDTRKAFDVMVKANMDYWTPNVTYEQAGCGVLKAAKDLNYALEDVKGSLSEVAIQYNSCLG